MNDWEMPTESANGNSPNGGDTGHEIDPAELQALLLEFRDACLSSGYVFNGQKVNIKALLATWMAEIDRLLSQQVDEILHHLEFQALESAWRGLWSLATYANRGLQLSVRVMQCSKRELLANFDAAADLESSFLYREIVPDAAGSWRDDPFGLLVGGFEFSSHPADQALLTRISLVAEAARAPFVSAAHPDLFGVDSFPDLNKKRDISKIFFTPEYKPWHLFRESSASRYVALCLPHVLQRAPYRGPTSNVGGWHYDEGVDGRDHSLYLWGNAAYALAGCVARAFANYGWLANIHGLASGGFVGNLPRHEYRSDEGDTAHKCPTELALHDYQNQELNRLGFVTLQHCKGQDYAAFFNVPSCQKPSYDLPTEIAVTVIDLHHTLTLARFAHYLCTMARFKRDGFATAEECAAYLREWLQGYVHPKPKIASPEELAAYPLAGARLEVRETQNAKRRFLVVGFLHFQYQFGPNNVPRRLEVLLPESVTGAR